MGKKEAEQKPAAQDGTAAPAAHAKGKAPAGKGAKPAAAAPAKKKVKGVPKKLYAIQGNKITRTKTECPKCGTGYFMAVHYNRRTCGKCSYTQFTDKDGNVRGFGGAPMGGLAGAIRQSRRLGRQPQGGGGGSSPAGDE